MEKIEKLRQEILDLAVKFNKEDLFEFFTTGGMISFNSWRQDVIDIYKKENK